MASGVVLTFLLNGQLEQDRLELALQWESLFVNYLKNFSSEHLDFAYMAERSVEDGIEEVSQAETVTVLISYAVMFVYITLALGRFRSLRTLLVSSIKRVLKVICQRI